MPRNIAVLGSTGSIGRQTLDIVREFPEQVQVVALAAARNVRALRDQCAEFRPLMAALSDEDPALDWDDTEVPLLRGAEGLVSLAGHPAVDIVVVATVGAAGLLPALAALRAGKLVALANKETLVMAGALFRSELAAGTGSLVPIDSEHSAIWQCLQGEAIGSVERLVLTASGGALRRLSRDELKSVTPEIALRHPTWTMGPKVTIDSATLMNKGLEVLEARWLFDIEIGKIELLLHEQSIVHSMVTFTDGSTKAQLGVPDMRLPIQYALSHPDRWCGSVKRLDLAGIRTLTFGAVDEERYPAVPLAFAAGTAGGTSPAVLCAADEIAVDAFLQGRVPFPRIVEIVEEVLQMHNNCPDPGLDDILGEDDWARRTATGLVKVESPR